MKSLLQYVFDNKEWIFSGIGVALLMAVTHKIWNSLFGKNFGGTYTFSKKKINEKHTLGGQTMIRSSNQKMGVPG